MGNEATSSRNVDKDSQYFVCFGRKCVLSNRIFLNFGALSWAQFCSCSGHSSIFTQHDVHTINQKGYKQLNRGAIAHGALGFRV